MATITDFSTPVNQVRAHIPDIEKIYDSATPPTKEYLFSDDHLQSFLDQAGGRVLRAAAFACYAVAGSEALILKVMSAGDKSTDGAKVGNFWLLRADRLSAQDKQDEADEFDQVQIVPFHLHPPHWEPR